MKKKFLSALILAGLTLTITNSAFAQAKVAVVDIPAVVAQSSQMQALQKEQQTKLKNLEKWFETASNDIQKQQTKENKEKLIKKYDVELAKKKSDIAIYYQKKLQEIDKNITNTIAEQAKLKGYDLVVTKGVVVYGGDDITADVQKALK